MTSIGTSPPRIDAPDKILGRARYVDDITFPGMLFARTIRSDTPRGTITSVDPAVDATFTVVTAADIPGKNAIYLIDDAQPCLADREVSHREEPIFLLAHPSRAALKAARPRVMIDPLEPEYDPRRSDRVLKEICIQKGDLAEGFAAADHIVEGEYETGHQEQLYIETNGVIALPDDGGVTIIGSLQCPYYVQKALIPLLALPADKIRVIQAETGGGFGGKEEYPSMIAGHAALLALKSGRPVKLIYDRVEDLRATTKRHPSIVRHRTGVTRDGRITAMDIDVLMDAGAYLTLSPVVLSRGVLHATGPYRVDHVRVRGRAVRTHTPPNGAFRGFGAPQTQFAAEVHIERIAEALAIDSLAIREKNALRSGDTTATGQTLGDDCSTHDVLSEAVKASGYREKRDAYRGTDRAIGIGLVFHGAGFTGSGEVYLASRASLELTPDGARILVASTEIGQGSRTTHAQIVADALGWPLSSIEVGEADTRKVPDSGPTVASRTCMIVGGLLERCARELRRRLDGASPAAYLAANGPLVITMEYAPPGDVRWDEATYQGEAYGTYGYACNIVEVEVDRDTGEVSPRRLTVAVDVGRAIHPQIVRGQIEGGALQGVGFALLEVVVMKDGRMENAQLTNYVIPTAQDAPSIDVRLIERPWKHGPAGAKGVGEIPVDGPAPAIVNALRFAGYDLRAIPATPERILESRATLKETGLERT